MHQNLSSNSKQNAEKAQNNQNNMQANRNNNLHQAQKLRQCPYLSSIRKHLLDFDFQKICSITLSHNNIYACLVCGRYFQGRSSTSPAYQHSIQFSHYVFINLQNSKIYCLPDDYEVDAYTIKDVQFNLKPKYNEESFAKLQKMEQLQYNVDGKQFMPGAMGMNNLGRTDYAATVIYLFNAISQIRRFFIYAQFQSEIVTQFSILLKKLWNPSSFKGIVSPHEFLQLVTDISTKKFKIGTQADPLTFFLWLKDTFTKQLKKDKKKHKIDIQKLFKGKLKTSIIKGIKNSHFYQQVPTKVQQIPFSVIKIQFPQKGVFNKTQSQVTLESMLQKYVGKMGEKHPQGLRYAKIIQFPSYLFLNFKRFINNGYTVQKDNSHLVYSQKLNITSNHMRANYKLIGQVCHIGDYLTGKYKVIFYMQQANKWFEIQDLQSKEIIEKQALLAQPYLQVYKLIREVKQNNQ